METETLLKTIVQICEDFKAVDLRVLKVGEICLFADYFVIMSGNSTVHVQSIAQELIYRCKHGGHPAASVEGLAKGTWCLLDFGDIVVHVFHPQQREYYDLEALWERPQKNTAASGAGET